MAIQRSRSISTAYEQCDVALIGGGIISATFGLLVSMLQPNWSMMTFERLARTAKESSDPWNNAGTGHAGLCELNYTTEKPDGTIDATKAININEQFQVSRQLWAHLVREGVLGEPSEFINPTPHMNFVNTAKNIDFLDRRYKTLVDHPLFASMEWTTDRDQIAEWAPLLVTGRDAGESVAATNDVTGTDVNFGSLTRQIFDHLQSNGMQLETNHEVIDLKRADDGGWLLKVHDRVNDTLKLAKARFVFVGAGGYALKMLDKAGIAEIKGYGLFPVSGLFLNSTEPSIVAQHHAKVYGMASVGAPPMSVPHLDARVIGGTQAVLFGPFAGWTPKFLKKGSYLDLLKTIRVHNLDKMANVALHNFDLLQYLVGEIFKSRSAQIESLRVFAPSAEASDWTMTVAGQRAQIIKPDANGKGVLQFGTEAIVSADRSIAAVLGASPGASVAVPLLLGLLERAFPEKMDEWAPKLVEIIPSYGTKLSDDPDRAREIMTETAEVLSITPPVR